MASDVDRAVIAAQTAFDTTWGLNCPGFKRGEYLIKIAELIERDLDQIASIESLDNGKTFSAAKAFDVSAVPLIPDSSPDFCGLPFCTTDIASF